MIIAEDLLKPVAEEKPCGEDLAYDPRFQELETILRGKPETQFAPAEEPDWKLLRERCLELWARSKDLRLATALALAELKTEGLPAFSECLALLKGLLERHWATVYPLLDPADSNDPTQRVNIITALATPVGTFGDPMRLLERLREAPLASSVQMGRFSLADILRSESGTAGADEPPPPSAAQIDAAFRDTGEERLLAIHQAAVSSLDAVNRIDEFLTQTIGADQAPDLEALLAELRGIQNRLTPYLPAGLVSTGPTEQRGPAEAGATGAGKPLSGEIQSRQDVVRLLDKICEYYSRTEPSSPVPCVLRRAQRLAEMDFMQIIQDLTPDALNQIRQITGEKPPEGG